MTAIPPAPTRSTIPPSHPDAKLYEDVKDALRALPAYFDSSTFIEGVEAGDLFSLNTFLGGTIELQVVETLNRIRSVWDPSGQYAECVFERRPQSFPDVRLMSYRGGTPTPVLGIELKGWYLLAKEAEPSFRYQVTPAACGLLDLLVVVPWHLKNVLSGTPVVYEPFIDQAHYAAAYRNYWWQHVRNAKTSSAINPPGGPVTPYPAAGVPISDKPVSDSGKNFGRVARIKGLMDAWTDDMLGLRVAGIPAVDWVLFFRTYTEGSDPAEVTEKLRAAFLKSVRGASETDAEHAVALLEELATLIRRESD